MFLKNNRFQNFGILFSWQSAYWTFMKPWVQSLVQYDVLACNSSISKVEAGDLKFNVIVGYKVGLRLTLATQLLSNFIGENHWL